MKHLISTLILGLALTSLAACGGKDKQTPATPDPNATPTMEGSAAEPTGEEPATEPGAGEPAAEEPAAGDMGGGGW